MSSLKRCYLSGVLLTSMLTLALPATSSGAENAPPAAPNDGGVNMLLKGTSDKDKVKFANDAVKEIREGTISLQRRAEAAKNDGNLELFNCVNEKYGTVNNLLKVAETANVLMVEAINTSNSTDAEHQFRKVVLARFKARQVVEEGNQCVGQEGTTSGQDDPSVVVEGSDSALTGAPSTEDPGASYDTPPVYDIPVDNPDASL